MIKKVQNPVEKTSNEFDTASGQGQLGPRLDIRIDQRKHPPLIHLLLLFPYLAEQEHVRDHRSLLGPEEKKKKTTARLGRSF